MCRLFGQHAHPGFDPTEPLRLAQLVGAAVRTGESGRRA